MNWTSLLRSLPRDLRETVAGDIEEESCSAARPSRPDLRRGMGVVRSGATRRGVPNRTIHTPA
jgi:hypothetical protein